jgi:homoserine kinase
LFAANNLLEKPMRRERIAALALDLCERPAEAVTALFGGLTITSAAVGTGDGAPLVYRRVELTRALAVVLVAPSIPHFTEKAHKTHPDRIAWREALAAAGRVALVAEGLRLGDFALLRDAMRDNLREPRLRPLIPGFSAAAEAARSQGAAGVSLSAEGPALVCLSRNNHDRIAHAVAEAFQAAGVAARTWILHVDTQGVAINAQR